jgi:hypothetical protein
MTYGSSVPGIAEQRVQKPILFVLEPKTEWFTRERSHSVGFAFKPSEPISRLPRFVSASLIISPGYSEMTAGWQEPGLSLVRASELQFALLEQRCLFRRRDEVIRFLKVYPFLVPLLLEACDKIAEYFAAFSGVVLEVITDPEAENDRELFAFIRTSLPPVEAFDGLDRLDEEWWLDASDKAKGKLCIHVEFE